MLQHANRVKVWFCLVCKTVGGEHYTLAKEMTEHIVDRYELNLPAKQLEHVLFLGDELIITKWNSSETKELIYARVCFFEILSANENTRESDQLYHVMFCVVFKEKNQVFVISDVFTEQICIEKIDRVVESFWLNM